MNAETRHGHDGNIAGKPQILIHNADLLQQRRAPLAVAVATWKKFVDDKAVNLAGMIAYFAFASMIPLLLLAFTILNLVLHNNPSLSQHLFSSALRKYPVIGPELAQHKPGTEGTGVALVVGSVLLLFGAQGVAVAMQNAMNSVWEVPQFRRPRPPWSLLRSLGLMAVIGPGLIVTTTLSGYAGGVGQLGGAGARVAASAVSLVLNMGLFWLGFRLATAREIASKDLRLSAILAAFGWQVLQLLGGYVVGHEAQTTSAYGVFGVVLGILFWFFLQAQITLYAAELNVVRVRRLWPRSLNPPPLLDADLRAYELYAQASQRSPDLEISVDQTSPAGRRGRQ